MNLNDRAKQIWLQCADAATELGISGSDKHGAGHLADFGIACPGSIAAGIRLSEICTAGLARIRVSKESADSARPTVEISTDRPLMACMAAQYAGWPFSTSDYFAMVSGPGRIGRGMEPVLQQYELVESQRDVVLVLESGNLPDQAAIAAMASECGVPVDHLYLSIAPTRSIAARIQIVARSVEATMHKLFELGFDLRRVKHGWGTAPLPPESDDDMVALGWTNDSILYGSRVALWIDADEQSSADIGSRLPSNQSPDFGKPFIDIFKSYDCDFYKIDPLLFGPAEVTLINFRTGQQHSFGETHRELLDQCFAMNQ